MITGIHAIFHSKHAADVYKFLGEVMDLRSVDAGNGRLMFAGPPLELAVHENDGEPEHELWLICDDVHATVAQLAAKGIETTPIVDRGWGLVTSVRIAEGEEIGLYEPNHPSPLRP